MILSSLITVLSFTGCMEVQHGWNLPDGDDGFCAACADDTGNTDTGDTASDTGDTDSGGETGDTADTSVDTGDTSDSGDTADTSDTSDTGGDTSDTSDSGDTSDTSDTGLSCEEQRGCDGQVATWCNADSSVGTTTCPSTEECLEDSLGNGYCEPLAVDTDPPVAEVYECDFSWTSPDYCSALYTEVEIADSVGYSWETSLGTTAAASYSISDTYSVESGQAIRLNAACINGSSVDFGVESTGSSTDFDEVWVRGTFTFVCTDSSGAAVVEDWSTYSKVSGTEDGGEILFWIDGDWTKSTKY